MFCRPLIKSSLRFNITSIDTKTNSSPTMSFHLHTSTDTETKIHHQQEAVWISQNSNSKDLKWWNLRIISLAHYLPKKREPTRRLAGFLHILYCTTKESYLGAASPCLNDISFESSICELIITHLNFSIELCSRDCRCQNRWNRGKDHDEGFRLHFGTLGCWLPVIRSRILEITKKNDDERVTEGKDGGMVAKTTDRTNLNHLGHFAGRHIWRLRVSWVGF